MNGSNITSSTYKSQECNGYGSKGVNKVERAQELNVDDAYYEVPHEISCCHRLNETSGTGVAPNPVFPGVANSACINTHDSDDRYTDEDRLNEGGDMNIPIDLGTSRKSGIMIGEEKC